MPPDGWDLRQPVEAWDGDGEAGAALGCVEGGREVVWDVLAWSEPREGDQRLLLRCRLGIGSAGEEGHVLRQWTRGGRPTVLGDAQDALLGVSGQGRESV